MGWLLLGLLLWAAWLCRPLAESPVQRELRAQGLAKAYAEGHRPWQHPDGGGLAECQRDGELWPCALVRALEHRE